MPGVILHVTAAKEAWMLADQLLPAHQHDALGVGAHGRDPTGKATIDAVPIALEVHQQDTSGRDTSGVFGIPVEGHRHRTQRRAFLIPEHLNDLAAALLRMVPFACQLQASRSQMRIELGQIHATYLRREQPLAHVADLVLNLALLPLPRPGCRRSDRRGK